VAIAPGTLIASRYKIVKLLGEGGFGAVYLAEDTRLGGKRVALKENFTRTKDAQVQFTLEAQLLANLEHRSLPRVTDSFIDSGGRQFLIMDYVEGVDLDERITSSGRPLPEREAVAIILQICDAVAYLHTRKPQPIIHRDIKPSNIKITTQNRAVLVDFGIAKIYHPRKGTAKVAKAITPHFSPPEQYGGTTDSRSDVYALGATLYALVCAAVPPDAMDRLVNQTPLRPPSVINPAISPALEQIILHALELDANRRFPNANHMAAALRGFLRGGHAHALPATGSAGQRCPKCGWINRPGARFCIRDGTRLGAVQPRKPRAAPPQPPPQQMPPELQFEIGNAHARNSKYPQAIASYEACIRAGFRDSAVYHNLGICYRLNNQTQQAIQILTQGLRDHPNDADLHFQLALSYTSAGKPPKATRHAKTACQINPQNDDFRRFYGQCLMDNQQYDEAIRQFDQAIRLNSRNADNHFWLGRAYSEKGDLKRGAKAFRKAAKLDTKNPDPYIHLGLMYEQHQKYKDAIAAYGNALKRVDTLAPVHFLIGRAYIQVDKHTQALQHLQKAVLIDPDDADYHTLLGLCYALLDRKTEAMKSIQNALRIDPANKPALELLRQLR